MDADQLLWNQYQQLSEEIKNADSLNYQALGAVVAASVAIVNAAFTRSSAEERCVLLLTVFAVTMPGAFLLQVGRRRVWRIATYLEIFIEPILVPIKWQMRLTNNGCLEATSVGSEIIKTEFWLVTGLDLVASALNLVTVLFVAALWKRYVDLFFVVLLLGHSVRRAMQSTPRFGRGGQVQSEFRRRWRDVADLEDESRPRMQG